MRPSLTEARVAAVWMCGLLLACGSGAGATKPQKICDGDCPTEVAARGLRETLKLAYNLTLTGKPVGAQDASHACLDGDVRVMGEAYSNAEQGATEVSLSYFFNDCVYRQVDATQAENYDLSFRGQVHEEGTLTVQPTATTAITIKGEGLAIDGSVFEPPIEFHEAACEVKLQQNGNKLSGTLCGRPVGVSL
jgi:hypothetical protein